LHFKISSKHETRHDVTEPQRVYSQSIRNHPMIYHPQVTCCVIAIISLKDSEIVETIVESENATRPWSCIGLRATGFLLGFVWPVADGVNRLLLSYPPMVEGSALPNLPSSLASQAMARPLSTALRS
jgi:hypothetical protein